MINFGGTLALFGKTASNSINKQLQIFIYLD